MNELLSKLNTNPFTSSFVNFYFSNKTQVLHSIYYLFIEF